MTTAIARKRKVVYPDTPEGRLRTELDRLADLNLTIAAENIALTDQLAVVRDLREADIAAWAKERAALLEIIRDLRAAPGVRRLVPCYQGTEGP